MFLGLLTSDWLMGVGGNVKRCILVIYVFSSQVYEFPQTVPATITRYNVPVSSYPGQFYVLIPTIVTDETKRKHKLRRMRKILKLNKKIRRQNRASFFPKKLLKETPYKPYKSVEKNETTEVIRRKINITKSEAR